MTDDRGTENVPAQPHMGRRCFAASVVAGPLIGSLPEPQATRYQVSPGSGGWTFYGYDSRGSRSSQEVNAPERLAETYWESGGLPCSPAISSGGTVYFGLDSGVVNAVDATTGEEEWSYNASRDPISASPILYRGTVYVLTEDADMYAVEASSGDELWSTSFDGGAPSSPLVYNGDLYFGTTEAFYSVSSSDGDINWDYSKDDTNVMTPAVASDGVYVYDGGFIYRLSRWNGSEQWGTLIGGTIDSVVIDSNRAYAVSRSVRSYNRETGSERWSSGIRGRVVGRPAVKDGIMYVSTDNGNLQAFDLSEESQLWSEELGATMLGSPAVVDDTVYAVSTDTFSDESEIHALDADTGDRSSRHLVAEEASSGPSVAGSAVYLGTDSGMYAVGDEAPTPPTALFNIVPSSPTEGQTVTLDASQSTEGDAPIEDFEWAIETSDGVRQMTGEEVDTELPEGDWQVGVNVVDSEGMSDTDTAVVEVEPSEESGEPEEAQARGDDVEDVEPTEEDDEDNLSGVILAAVLGVGGLAALVMKLRGNDEEEDELVKRYKERE